MEFKISTDSHGWISLKSIASKFTIRASSIDKKKKRIKDTDGHAVDEAIAEGGVKITPRSFDIRNLKV